MEYGQSALELNAVGSSSYQNFTSQKMHFYWEDCCFFLKWLFWKALQHCFCRFAQVSIVGSGLCTCAFADLRDDKQFFADHPGTSPISTPQVGSPVTYAHHQLLWFWGIRLIIFLLACRNKNCFSVYWEGLHSTAQQWLIVLVQGEELRKAIGAASYIECSSKTQQVKRCWVWAQFVTKVCC